MALENWIDDLSAVWDEVTDGKARPILSYRLFEKATFPEALTVFPCALTYVKALRPTYTASNSINLWDGVTEFHLVNSEKKHLIPELLPYIKKIRDAAAKHITLGGKVAYFYIRSDQTGIEGPVRLVYGAEMPHWGYIVSWTVKEIDTVMVGG